MLDRHGWQFARNLHRTSNKWLYGIMFCSVERFRHVEPSGGYGTHERITERGGGGRGGRERGGWERDWSVWWKFGGRRVGLASYGRRVR